MAMNRMLSQSLRLGAVTNDPLNVALPCVTVSLYVCPAASPRTSTVCLYLSSPSSQDPCASPEMFWLRSALM
jgi:hypothetical protein